MSTLIEIIRRVIKEETLLIKETNQTVGRKSSDPAWVKNDAALNKLIAQIEFPVLAKVDTSYGDAFIYVNPKNRKLLDEFMSKNSYKLRQEGGQVWYENPKFQTIMTNDYGGGLYQIKVKNKMNVPL
jgi:hypothetical protein